MAASSVSDGETPCDRAEFLSNGETDPAHPVATLWCDDCNMLLCPKCDDQVHSEAEGLDHQRLPIGADAEDEGFVVDIAEEEFIDRLDAEQDSHHICQRLFRPWSEIEERVADLRVLRLNDIQQLYRHGFVVLARGFLSDDDSTSEAIATAIRECAIERHREGKLKPPGQEMEHDPYRDVKARGDFTGWLSSGEETNKELAHVLQRYQLLQQDLCSCLRLDGHSEKQMALYVDPGAGYSRHRDALPDSNDESNDRTRGLGIGKQRRVTAIMYTSSDWQPEHGGCLRIFPTPAQLADDTDISPNAGKLLVFLSGAMSHEVLPSFQPRVAITHWYW